MSECSFLLIDLMENHQSRIYLIKYTSWNSGRTSKVGERVCGVLQTAALQLP